MAAWFVLLVSLCLTASTAGVQYQHRLRRRLHKSKDLNDRSSRYVRVFSVVETDDGEYAVHVHSGLCHDQ